MDEHELERLRERLLDAGVSRPGVQADERDRLKVIVPHRGQAPPPARTRMSAGHRGRKEAGDLHRQTGKRFNRRRKVDREKVVW